MRLGHGGGHEFPMAAMCGSMMRNYWDDMTNHLMILHRRHLRLLFCMYVTCKIQK
jgi:hypothetical protein